MRCLIRGGVLLVLILAARPSSADLVTLDFTGPLVTDVTGILGPGPVSGSVVYDSSYPAGFDFGGSSFAHSITLTIGTFTYTTQGVSFQVSPEGDFFRVLAQAPTFFGPPGGSPFSFNQVELNLTSSSSNAFPLGKLPTAQTFLDAAPTLTGGTASFNNRGNLLTYGSVSSLSVNGQSVPEPASMTLLLLGGAVFFVGRQMRAHRKK